MDYTLYLAIVLSFLVVSIAFRQLNLHLKLKDLLEVDLKAERASGKKQGGESGD